MIRIGKILADRAVVSPVALHDVGNGGVLQAIRRPDGSKVVALSRDAHERALSRAKSVLARK
ncbi:hypothetical protein ASD79_05465 [Caulobacter sp. Root655]|nr:hypothetical protein ASD79_05465 [Caulobacter sp. Root655]